MIIELVLLIKYNNRINCIIIIIVLLFLSYLLISLLYQHLSLCVCYVCTISDSLSCIISFYVDMICNQFTLYSFIWQVT